MPSGFVKSPLASSCVLSMLLFMILCLFSQEAHAQTIPQDTTTLYVVKTTDGNSFIGYIVAQNEEFILLKTRNLNEITISRNDIIEITRYRGVQPAVEEPEEVGWPANPQSTRYFWAPNGYGLRKGEGYYQNIWVLFNQASIGVTNNFSIGVGTVPLFMFGGSPSPVWLTPKFSLPIVKDKLNIGAGALVGGVLGLERSGFGILYGITTLGTRDRNASFGIGYGYSSAGLADIPTFTAGGLLRISRKWYLLSENYFINIHDTETFALLMFGSRVMLRKVGLDFGLVAPYFREIDGLYAIPWLGFSVPFQLQE